MESNCEKQSQSEKEVIYKSSGFRLLTSGLISKL
jgi:hypothetical protein